MDEFRYLGESPLRGQDRRIIGKCVFPFVRSIRQGRNGRRRRESFLIRILVLQNIGAGKRRVNRASRQRMLYIVSRSWLLRGKSSSS